MYIQKIKNIRKDICVEKVLYAPICESMDPLMRIGYKLTAGRGAAKCDSNAIPYYRFIARAIFHKGEVKPASKSDDVAVILHSGGTTGKPKGIELTNKNMNAVVQSGIEINKVLGPGNTLLGIMPIFHGFGLGISYHSSFSCGGTTIMLPSVSPKTSVKVVPTFIG